jgi:hypothetical protein
LHPLPRWRRQPKIDLFNSNFKSPISNQRFNDYKYKDNEKFDDTYIRYLVQFFIRFKACPIERFLIGIVRNYPE